MFRPVVSSWFSVVELRAEESRRYLRDMSIIAGDDLSPQKARILLSLMLARTSDPEKIAEAFETY